VALYSRYFHAERGTSPRVSCFWGSCLYPIGDYWNYGQYHRVTLTLTSASGPIDNMSMYSWTGVLPAVTRVTAENFLDMGASPPVGHSATADFPAGSDGFSIEVKSGDSAYPLDVRVDFELAPGDVGYCQYGTRIQPNQQLVGVISEAVIAAATALVPELVWLEVSFGALIGISWVPGTFCTGPPPDMPHFGPDDFIVGTKIPAPGSIGKFLTALQSALWPSYCECLPATGGGPTPITYPPGRQEQEPGTPGPIAPVVCDNTNLCASIDAISRRLTAIGGQLTLMRQDVQLIQRQGVPFGYLVGASHGPLTGSGDFAIADLIGLEVSFSVIPPIPGHSAGDPDTYHQIGKVSLGTAQGWRRSWMPTHSPYLIFPVSGAFTRVGYTFPAGITATIAELVREP